MVAAVATDVEIGPAGVAGVPEADAVDGREFDGSAAREAAHARSLRHARLPVNARPLGTARGHAYPGRVNAKSSFEVAGVRWWLSAGSDAAALKPRLERALQQLDGAEDLRSGRRKRLFRLALGAGGGPDHLLKRCGYPPSRGWLQHARGSKARRELSIAESLARRGVPVVVPLAAGERRRAGRLIECFLLVPLLEAAIDLRRLWNDPALTGSERRHLVTSLGEILRHAHSAGLYQDDLAPNNVLATGGSTAGLRLVDFERARLRPRLGTRARRRTLAKLARAAAAVSSAQRLRFLRAYAGTSAEARRWWERLRAEAPQLARRDDMRMRRTATRDGRRFQRIERGDWRGFALRGAEPGPALAGLSAAPPPAAGSARIEIADGVWRVIYPRLSAGRARRLWARANTLAARGLAPVPLALLSDPHRTLLVVEPGAGARPLGLLASGDTERRAAARLLVELEGLGELREGLSAEAFALVRTGVARLGAQIVAPHAFCFGGRSGSRRSHGVAARLLASLASPPADV